MPSISMFYGIVIYMFFEDNKQHKKPHIHAKYGDSKAVFDIASTEILEGKFPHKETKFVQAWILLRQEELKANWHLAVNNETPFRIEPLR